MFAMDKLRLLTQKEKNNENLKLLIQRSHFDHLIDTLISSIDPTMKYTASFVLINIVYISPELCDYLCNDSKRIQQLFQTMIQSKEYLVQKNILWIFANLFGESEEYCHKIISACDIISFVFELLNNDQSPNFMKSSSLWILANLLRVEKFNNLLEPSLTVIDKVSKYVRIIIDANCFRETINLFRVMLRSKDDRIPERLVQNEIHIEIMKHLAFDTDIRDLESVVKIIGNFAYFNVKYCISMYENGVIEKFESLLQDVIQRNNAGEFINKNPDLFKEIFWTLCMFIESTTEIKDFLIRKTQIAKTLLTLAPLITKKVVLTEIMYFFNEGLHTDDFNVKFDLLRLHVLELFYNNMNNDDPTISFLSLQGIQSLLNYGEIVMKNSNIVKSELELNNVPTLIEHLINSNDKEVASISFEICSTHFSDNHE